MSEQLKGKRIAFLVANEGVEQVELTEPLAGGDAVPAPRSRSVAPDDGEVQAFNHLDKADTFKVDGPSATADAADYDGLVLPGGVANPDNLRTHADAVGFVRAFFEAGKPVGAICHAPWTLVEADVVDGRTRHLVAEPADRPPQRRRRVGRRGGPRRPGPGHEPQPRRPPGVQRQDRRGVRRGRARGPARLTPGTPSTGRRSGGDRCGRGDRPVSAGRAQEVALDPVDDRATPSAARAAPAATRRRPRGARPGPGQGRWPVRSAQPR